ncbi:hypothetical protein Tco_0646118, partial [Tanacetum coccineum]
MSSEEAEKESTNSDSNDDDETHKLEEDAKAEAAKQEGEVRKAELVDLLGPEVVNKYYNDKFQYDRYYDKMLNRRAESRITNCDVLTKKGPITLKVYREDGTSEVIPNFKASDLHLGEWREVVKACPNRTGKGWKTIYGQIQTRMDYLHTTEAELGINLDIPLSEQDPLDKLNDLANKKRKHADDIHDYFKANKRLKSSVQYEDHLPGTVLNEHVLGMIMFNSYHRQDFVTIEDLKDFSNTMLYTVQEIFFRRHQGPGLDDHARTFSSLLLAEVDKRNLNPLKQMRIIEQLRHGTEIEEGLWKELYVGFQKFLQLNEFHDDNPPPPPPVTPTQQASHTLSTIKLPILKKGEYDIWAMKMEHYLGHTDYPIWEIIQKENGPVQVLTDTNGQIKVLPPKTAEEILARERERKARTTLLMAIPEDHLAKFHKMNDAKEM